jgi:hypothetical protein
MKFQKLFSKTEPDSITGYEVEIKEGLFASFIMAGGESRPGVDWAVKIKTKEKEYPLVVRDFLSSQESTEKEREESTVATIRFIKAKLKEGWIPESPPKSILTLPQKKTEPDGPGQRR